MKKFLALFALFLVGTLYCAAQVEVKDNSVYSPKGFVEKKGSFKIDKKTYYYSGLYSADGKVCVRINWGGW